MKTQSRRWLSVVWATGFFLCLAARAPAADFVRGDVDASGSLSVSDAIRILQFLFVGAADAVTCQDAAVSAH